MNFFLVISSLLVFSACSSRKIKVSAIEPAAIEGLTKTRVITFDYLSNDRFGVGGVIEGTVGGYSLDGNKPYFKVVERKNIKSILDEQSLSATWLVDPEQRARIGKMTGAEAVITGELLNFSSSDSYHDSSRSRCASQNSKGHCTSYQSYTVRCTDRTFSLSTLLKVVNTTTGDHTYSNTFTEQATYSKCPDHGSIPDSGQVMTDLAQKIGASLISKIAPTKYDLEIQLIEKLSDVDDPNDTQEQLFESGIEFAKAGRVDKGLDFFKRLGESLEWKSYVVSYNYAVMLEASGELSEAQKYYKTADDLATEPIEEINQAVTRIASRLKKNEKLVKQLESRD